MEKPSAGLDFLRLLDALIRRDPGPPGFQGTLCVGVVGGQTSYWWTAQFGPRIKTWFSNEPNPSDTIVIAHEDEVRPLLRASEGASPNFDILGNRRLLSKVAARYFRQARSLLSLRGDGNER